MLARVCPAGMLFTPSVDGISHNPTEFTHPDDLEAGANVLLDVILRLATLPEATLRGARPDTSVEPGKVDEAAEKGTAS
jgi:hypothetical protein